MHGYKRGLIFFFCLLLLNGCKNPTLDPNQRGFYFWKSNLQLKSTELEALNELSIQHLYVKFFDVSWDAEKQMPVPVAVVDVKSTIPENIQITPVVFITQDVLKNLNTYGAAKLAQKMNDRLSALASEHDFNLSNEVQIDCDWNANNKAVYFELLDSLKTQSFFANKILSATIRLHQVKYINENGIPPVDKGLLMCYNMGNLRDVAAKNSIIDPQTFKSYMGRAADYPLPLDIALPLFEWWVWFRNERFYGLIHAGNLPKQMATGVRYVFANDSIINDYHFAENDFIRHEQSAISDLEQVIKLLPKKLRESQNKLLLYHLDSASLSNYSFHEIETIYRKYH